MEYVFKKIKKKQHTHGDLARSTVGNCRRFQSVFPLDERMFNSLYLSHCINCTFFICNCIFYNLIVVYI